MSSDILPPRYPSPMPQIPPQSKPPLDLLGDEEPTIKMQVPPHLLHQSRRGPNWGLLLGLAFCLAFWGSVAYFIFR
jgi:hypothetical protein